MNLFEINEGNRRGVRFAISSEITQLRKSNDSALCKLGSIIAELNRGWPEVELNAAARTRLDAAEQLLFNALKDTSNQCRLELDNFRTVAIKEARSAQDRIK